MLGPFESLPVSQHSKCNGGWASGNLSCCWDKIWRGCCGRASGESCAWVQGFSVELVLLGGSKGCALPGSAAWCWLGSYLTVHLQENQTGVLILRLLTLAYSWCIFLTRFFIGILSNHIQMKLMICCSGLQTFHPLMLLFWLYFSLLVKQQF